MRRGGRNAACGGEGAEFVNEIRTRATRTRWTGDFAGVRAAVPHAEALRIRDDGAFFPAVLVVLTKRAPGAAKSEKVLDHAVTSTAARSARRARSSGFTRWFNPRYTPRARGRPRSRRRRGRPRASPASRAAPY